MATCDELRARLEALYKAMDEGVRIVQQGDRQITYRSLAEMQSAVESLKGRIASQCGDGVTQFQRNRKYAQHSRGY